jgi:hypothetical protein
VHQARRWRVLDACGTRTCTTTAAWHILWNFLLLKPAYPFLGANLHFLCMFVAPVLLGQ